MGLGPKAAVHAILNDWHLAVGLFVIPLLIAANGVILDYDDRLKRHSAKRAA